MSEPAISATIWALALPEAGFRSQVIGLAETVGGRAEIKNVDLAAPWRYLPASFCRRPLSALTHASDQLTAPWPDAVIACGRRTIPLAIAIKRASQNRTKLIYIQNPKASASEFDLIISMRHDGLRGDHVLTVDTAMHRVTDTMLNAAKEAHDPRLDVLPRPLLGVVLGGRNKNFRFTQRVALRLIDQLAHLQNETDAGIAITPSRRTEQDIKDVFRAYAHKSENVFFWDEQGDNPYLGILGKADALIVTEDSVSMVSEALATRKPVATVPLAGTAKRHEAFIDALLRRDAITRFTGSWPELRSAPQQDATQRAAHAVRMVLQQSA
jgi:uncharacterized protein